MATDYLGEFASEVGGQSYSALYPSSARTAPARTNPTRQIETNPSYMLPSSVGSDLASVEQAFSGASNTDYLTAYNPANRTESRTTAAENLASTPAVSDIPFGFANALFENQLTPSSVNTILTKQGNNAVNFGTQALGFLTNRTTLPQKETILQEIGIGGPASGPGGYGAGGGGGVSPDTSALLPPSTAPSQQQQQQQQIQQQQNQNPGSGPGTNPDNASILGGGGGSDATSAPSNPFSGIMGSIDAFIQAHPVLTLIILAGGAFLLFGGGHGGKRR